MDPLFDLFSSLVNVIWSLLDVVVNLVRVILPWLPLLAWVGFWTFAVNWAKTLPMLRRGGFIGILLLMFVAVLVWAAVAPREWQTSDARTVGKQSRRQVYLCHDADLHALLCGSCRNFQDPLDDWLNFLRNQVPMITVTNMTTHMVATITAMMSHMLISD